MNNYEYLAREIFIKLCVIISYQFYKFFFPLPFAFFHRSTEEQSHHLHSMINRNHEYVAV